jgi:hypothetical protein
MTCSNSVGVSLAACRQNISDTGNWRECLAHLVLRFGLRLPADASGVFVGWFSFDLFPPFENGLAASERDVSRRQVVQALMVWTVVIVLDELLDALFQQRNR